MITNSDLKIHNTSYINKDFYQIYPELLELVNKITDRWDPSASNESDPGVVLLKLLAFIADKINYNIDKNILECFMPSATQEDSMRKLCEMLGYDMKYNQSATTKVSFMWIGDELDTKESYQGDNTSYIHLPAFETILTNDSNDINYILTNDVFLNTRYEVYEAEAIEGQLVELEINSDNILQLHNLDSKNRFYLPERNIAQNGIWLIDPETGKKWSQVTNLNLAVFEEDVENKSHIVNTIWKFGYNSKLKLPYIQFADNINEYLTKGLKVKYIRTSGSAGNVKAKALNKLVNQTIKLHKCENQVFTEEDCVADDTKLTIQNPNSSVNGFDMETIDQAYENFKHQVGTFDTLITCFDYANAIYNMINDTFKDNTPLVSNCQVSDKKDDINFTNTVIQYDRYGIKYENIGTQTAKTYKGKVSVNQDVQYLNEIELKDKNGISIRVPIDSIIHNQNISQLELNFDSQSESISAFDLYIYPLNPIRTSYTTTTYQNSFKPNFSTFNQINEQLEDYKCMAHTIHIVDEDSDPQNKDRYVYLIKNYYSLQAKISTTHKVTSFEVLQIRNNINEALFKQFNARKLEYGEEISYDELLKVIQEADPRIKYVILDEPTITTKFMTESGNEYDLKFTAINEADPTEIKEKKQKQNDVYQKLIAKNVLAGRAPLFKYNQDIEVDFNKEGSEQIYGTTFNYLTTDDTSTIKDKSITAISSDLKLNLSKIDNSTGYTLRANESLQVVNNALVDLISYPMYINYYFKGNDNRFKNNIKFNRAAYLQEITSKTVKDWNREYAYDNPTSDLYIENNSSDSELSLSVLKELIIKLNLNGYDIYWLAKKSNLGAKVGELVDENLNEYKKVGGRTGALYSTDFTINAGTKYFIDRSIKNINNKNLWDISQISSKPELLEKIFKSDLIKTVYNEDKSVNSKTTIYSYKNSVGIINYLKAIYSVMQPNGDVTNLSDSQLINWFENTYYPNVTTNSEKGYYTNYHVRAVPSENCEYEFAIYTIGETTPLPFIKKDTPYQLERGDSLYINYVDNSGRTLNYEYLCDAKGQYKVLLNGVEDLSENSLGFQGIIKANFDLYPSDMYKNVGAGHSYSKTEGYSFDKTIVPGMFSLLNTEEIVIKGFSSGAMKQKSYIYWMANNNNTLTFKLESNTPEKGFYKYSYILNDNEFLFYTDQSKSYLTTLGSGTKLELWRNVRLNSEPSETISWVLSNEHNITVDDIGQNGIGAFADTDWILKNFSEEFEYLVTYDLEINTFTENDTIYLPGEFAEIDSKAWYKLSPNTVISYKREGETTISTLESLGNTTSANYYIRPMLNINVGPQNTQSLKATEIATPSIKVYTSEFFDKNGKKYYLNDEIKELILNDNSSLVERIYTSKEIMEFKDVDIRSNVNINLLGGQFISTRNPNFNGTDDLKIYSFEEKFASCYDPTTEKTSYFEATEWNTGKDLQYFSNNKSVNLSIFVPKGTMNILTIYLESTAESRLKLSVVNKNKDSNQLGPKVIGKFNTVLKDAWKNSLTLKNGLNTIMIKEGCELKLENDPKLPALGKIWILNMNNIITTDNELGVNYTYLGIPNNQVTEFIDKYILKTENKIKDKFYINFPLTNNIIDQTTLDNPYSWIDINNVCSKFVLSEIDVKSLNENNINVIKSSRL